MLRGVIVRNNNPVRTRNGVVCVCVFRVGLVVQHLFVLTLRRLAGYMYTHVVALLDNRKIQYKQQDREGPVAIYCFSPYVLM